MVVCWVSKKLRDFSKHYNRVLCYSFPRSNKYLRYLYNGFLDKVDLCTMRHTITESSVLGNCLMTPWSISWKTEVVFGGNKMSWIFFKLEINRCTGQLSGRRAIYFFFSLFSQTHVWFFTYSVTTRYCCKFYSERDKHRAANLLSTGEAAIYSKKIKKLFILLSKIFGQACGSILQIGICISI